MKNALCVLVLAVVTWTGDVTGQMTKPDWCTVSTWWSTKEYDCPLFSSENIPSSDGGKTELRTYQPTVTWMSVGPGSNENNMFMKLFDYIKANKIDMTIPVPKKYNVLPNGRPALASMSFYIVENNPPQPTNGELYKETWTNKQMYTRSFSMSFGWWRWPSDSDFQRELGKLKKTLDAAGLAYKEGTYYQSQLSSPWTFDKKGEVWLEVA